MFSWTDFFGPKLLRLEMLEIIAPLEAYDRGSFLEDPKILLILDLIPPRDDIISIAAEDAGVET